MVRLTDRLIFFPGLLTMWLNGINQDEFLCVKDYTFSSFSTKLDDQNDQNHTVTTATQQILIFEQRFQTVCTIFIQLPQLLKLRWALHSNTSLSSHKNSKYECNWSMKKTSWDSVKVKFSLWCAMFLIMSFAVLHPAPASVHLIHTYSTNYEET